MNKYSAAIIGLGQIGQGYDFNIDDDKLILSHASALTYHNSFDLISAVDPNRKERDRFEKKFLKPTFSSSKQLYSQVNPDVIIISAPSSYHFQLFQEAIAQNPKAIVLEKPIASLEEEAAEMLKISRNSNSVVCVNYSRRFNPALQELKKIIDQGDLGQIYKGVIWYTKGIINNGSHFIDLLIWLFGNIKNIKVINSGRKWDNKDPEPDLCISFSNTKIYMLSGREENYYMGSMRLVATNGEVNYIDGEDIQIQFAGNDPMYLDYKSLTDIKNLSNSSENNIWYLYENLALHLEGKNSLLSDINSGALVMSNVMKIIKKLKGIHE